MPVYSVELGDCPIYSELAVEADNLSDAVAEAKRQIVGIFRAGLPIRVFDQDDERELAAELWRPLEENPLKTSSGAKFEAAGPVRVIPYRV